MSKIYISIVSHGHDSFIANNQELKKVGRIDNVIIVIKDNVGSDSLKRVCNKNGYIYLQSEKQLGFGENNNDVFNYCKENGDNNDDWFICLNPDVVIANDQFLLLVQELNNANFDLYTVNLFRDQSLIVPENSLRYFPTWSSLFNVFKNTSITKVYHKESLDNYSEVEWASGAFLIFRFSLYESLNGYDTSYFMYYEDVDICYRSRNVFGVSVRYLSKIKAVHAGAYNNRKVFSKHFLWYFKSLMRFLSRA